MFCLLLKVKRMENKKCIFVIIGEKEKKRIFVLTEAFYCLTEEITRFILV